MIKINELLFHILTISWMILAVVVFFVLRFVSAPYGRFIRRGWGPMISNRMGWIMMELPSLLVFTGFIFLNENPESDVVYIFTAFWVIHYINRSLIFPFRLKTKGKKMPLTIALMAIFFNAANASLNGYYLSYAHFLYPDGWWFDPRFIVGILLFLMGMYINMKADNHLIYLRKQNNNHYVIPRQGLFHWISCPNYFGEIIEWLGFAVMVWSLPALSFLVWTVANLVPRALSYHHWYQRTFPDYPPYRKAIIPYIL